MTRIALGIEYCGAQYNGWQRQKHHTELASVQQELEGALSQVAAQPITVYCAGRTDSKVHATGQVVHFDYSSDKPRDLQAWVRGGNTLLPNDISINWAYKVRDDFHARFSAISRRYHYYIYNYPVKRASLSERALWVNKPLNIAAMNKACEYLLGEQDFSSLRSSQCESRTPYRNIILAEIKQYNNFTYLDIEANAFLHHMVRNIVGCLLEIGLNNKPASWLEEVISQRDRTKAGKTAPPDGLYLVSVGYPSIEQLTKDILLPF